MRIPAALTEWLIELDAVLLHGTLRRAVRNYGDRDPRDRADGDIAAREASRLIRGIRRELTMPAERYVRPCDTPRFIGATTGRSGTTWLNDVLRYGLGDACVSIREVGLFDLAQFRGAPYEYFQYANLSQRQVYRDYFRSFVLERAYFIRRKLDGTLPGLCDLLPRRMVKVALEHLEDRLEESRSLPEIERSFGDFYLWLFNAHAELVGDGRPWISKEPPYGRHAHRLFRMIPDARLVVLVRDGRDVALSMFGHGWHPTVRHAMDRWRHFTRMTAEALDRCPADRYLLVRYRDLVDDFPSVCERITGFLQVPPLDRGALEDHDLLPDPASLQRWREELSSEDEAYFRASCGDLMDRFGLPL